MKEELLTYKDMANRVVEIATRSPKPIIMVGPLVDRPDIADPYFIIAFSDPDESDGFALEQIVLVGEELTLGEQAREQFMQGLTFATLSQPKKGVVIHHLENELEMAKYANVLCPCDRTRRIRQGVEEERAAQQDG